MASESRRLRFAPRSIRGKLLLIVIAAIVATSALVTIVSAQMLGGFLDLRVERRVEAIAHQIRSTAEKSPATADATALRAFLPTGSIVPIQPEAGGDPVTFGSLDVDPQEISDAIASAPAGKMRQTTVTETRGGRSESRDVAVVKVDTRDLKIRLAGLDQPVVAESVVFATDITDDKATLASLVWVEVVIGLVAAVVVGVASALIIRVGFRPLTTMTATADAITSGDRLQRLPARSTGTETDRLAVSVNSALDAQHRAELRLRTFMDDVSHELRTPLTTINGWIDLYLQGGLEDTAERDRAMERVESEISRMRMLVDELTLLSRLDSHRPLDAVGVDLADVAREIVDDATVVADDRPITCTAESVVVLGDPARLAQVLRNLVGNAIQHTATGTPVHVEVTRVGDEAIIRVNDEGPGIPSADLPHLFERFWRAEPSRSRATGGSGLGLSIVASIVEAHGGAIRVRSDETSGTTFTVSLPAMAHGSPDGNTPAARDHSRG